MKKLVVAAVAILSLGLAGPALAGCEICVESVSGHTRDGAEWRGGQPITLVVTVARAGAGAAFPDEAPAVVMELDRERVKCLNVRLSKISEQGGSATYAGTFYPFRQGEYDGKVDFGGQPQDIAFIVGASVGPAPIAPDTSVPVSAREAEAAPPPLVNVEAAASALPYAAGALALALLAAFGGRRLVPFRRSTEQRLRLEIE